MLKQSQLLITIDSHFRTLYNMSKNVKSVQIQQKTHKTLSELEHVNKGVSCMLFYFLNY